MRRQSTEQDDLRTRRLRRTETAAQILMANIYQSWNHLYDTDNCVMGVELSQLAAKYHYKCNIPLCIVT
jgi:hypothetical protein